MDARLIERDAPLAALDSLAASLTTGQGRIALVSGEAGVGKSALIDAFVARSRTTATRLWGACDALFTPRPLGPLYDIAQQTGGRLQALLDNHTDRATLFSAFLDTLQQYGGPVIVVVEDIHWADEATLDLIKFLGRRIHQTPALLILTYRDDEVGAGHPLGTVLGDLPTRSLTRVRLQPLSPAGVAALADQAPRATDELDRLYAITGGNPFFVTEALASETSGVPDTVRDAVLARASRLSARARATLDLAAVVPGRIEEWVVDAIPDVELSGFEECLASGMLRRENDAFAFRHELARLAVESALPASRLQGLHTQALRALLQAPERRVDAARLVHHAAQAGDRETVLRFAPEAARQAALQGAHREAAAQYRTALRFAGAVKAETRAALLEGLAAECYLTGGMDEAARAGEEALVIRRAGDVPQRVGRDLRWLSRVYWYLGRKADADQHVDAAIRLLETLPPDGELALVYCYRAMFAMLADEVADAQLWGSGAIDLAERLGNDEALIHALNTTGMARLYAGDELGRESLTRSLRLARELGLEEHVARAYANFSCYSTRFRDYAGARRYTDEGIAYCADRDLGLYGLQLVSWRALADLEHGHWTGASENANTVLSAHLVAPVDRIQALVALGWLRVRRGDPGGMPLLDEARDLALPTGELQRIAPVTAARAEAAWLRGDLESCAAEAHVGLDLATKHSNPWPLGQLSFWLWRAGVMDAPPHGAARPFALQMAGDWQAAATAWEELGCPYERALALLDGDESAQRIALGIFEELGAQPAAEIARRILRQVGARGLPRGPRTATRANPAGLTNRQVEILGLLVAGLRNTEIAEKLSMTPKTVEHHVSAVLAKLGARSRAEAAAVAKALGIIAENNASPHETPSQQR